MTIAEFLEARIAEDEAMAQACDSATWRIISEDDTRHPSWVEGLNIAAADSTWDACIAIADAHHATRHNPSRVLAECAAKRAIIRYSPDKTLRHLAAVYADHPDFQKAWSLNG